VYGCGWNEHGQLGIGHISKDKEGNAERSFVSIPSLTGVKFFGTGSFSFSSFAALS
jgi:alpha-tubulin suppressor-like RCC1 family protein